MIFDLNDDVIKVIMTKLTPKELCMWAGTCTSVKNNQWVRSMVCRLRRDYVKKRYFFEHPIKMYERFQTHLQRQGIQGFRPHCESNGDPASHLSYRAYATCLRGDVRFGDRGSDKYLYVDDVASRQMAEWDIKVQCMTTTLHLAGKEINFFRIYMASPLGI